MSDYQGTYELQALYDSHQSFHGKAFVERRDTGRGTQWVLESYGTTVATVTPTSAPDADIEACEVRIAMQYLSATTLRHVKEFLAQTDDVFKGITLPWPRKAIKDGEPIESGPPWPKTYTVKAM